MSRSQTHAEEAIFLTRDFPKYTLQLHDLLGVGDDLGHADNLMRTEKATKDV